MRGKGFSRLTLTDVPRITPAYAGKSRPRQTAKKGYWDHPRLCGEKFSASATCPSPSGSPPPMRGKGSGAVLGQSFHRITPAYAGKSVPCL